MKNFTFVRLFLLYMEGYNRYLVANAATGTPFLVWAKRKGGKIRPKGEFRFPP